MVGWIGNDVEGSARGLLQGRPTYDSWTSQERTEENHANFS